MNNDNIIKEINNINNDNSINNRNFTNKVIPGKGKI